MGLQHLKHNHVETRHQQRCYIEQSWKMHGAGCWRHPLFRCRWWLHWKGTVGTQPCEPNLVAGQGFQNHQLPFSTQRWKSRMFPNYSITSVLYEDTIYLVAMDQSIGLHLFAYDTSNHSAWPVVGTNNYHAGQNLLTVIDDTIYFDAPKSG